MATRAEQFKADDQRKTSVRKKKKKASAKKKKKSIVAKSAKPKTRTKKSAPREIAAETSENTPRRRFERQK